MEKKAPQKKTDDATAAKRKRVFRRLIILFWLGVLSPVLVLVIMLTMAATGGFGELPSFEELENPKSNLATEVFSADHELLGKYFRENRVNVSYEELSPYLVKALIATEDERFREHSGIDIRSVFRAVAYMGKKGGASTLTQQLAKMLFSEKPSSTFGRIRQKFQEWIIAVQLERRYTKDEIITMYLNRFDFVNNAVGVKSASLVYFNRQPEDLKIQEAAMLVGMAKNPSLYNPLRHKERATKRRNTVLFQMKRNGYINETQYDSIKALPLELDFHVVDHNEGPAPYFREALREELKALFNQKDENGDYVLHKKDGKKYDINRDGLKIYTTIDSRMQKYAEYAVTQHLSSDLQPLFNKKLEKKRNRPFSWKVNQKQIDGIMASARNRSQRYQVLKGKQCYNCGRRGKYLDIDGDSIRCNADDCLKAIPHRSDEEIEKIFNTPVKMKVFDWRAGKVDRFEVDTVLSPYDSIRHYKGFFQAGMMSMDPHTGFVKAWVGGINHHHFKYDHVKKAKRQVGSTFKPFLYAAYLNDGHSPCEEFPNQPVRFEADEWSLPQDWQPKNSGGEYGGLVSLKFGLANSLNTISARIMKKFGPKAGPNAVIDMARSLGIKSRLDPVPSLCLGVADLSVYEMVGANAAFANQGIFIKPIYYTRIEDKHGNVIFDIEPEMTEAMSEETAYAMLSLMQGVTQGVYNKETGKTSSTGIRIRSKSKSRPYGGFKNPIAGKTGTTQNNSDGWFMGITPDLVTGVWVGAEDRSVHFDQTQFGQGANTALPIWGYYMQKVFADKKLKYSQGNFEKPASGSIDQLLDCQEYLNINAPYEEINYDDEEL